MMRIHSIGLQAVPAFLDWVEGPLVVGYSVATSGDLQHRRVVCGYV